VERRTLALLLALALPATGEPVAEHIRKLGSPDFARREEATRALEQVGATALPALLEAEKHPDPEVRRRATALVRSADERQLARDVLRPRRVRLQFASTWLPDALRDVERQTGLKAVLTSKPDRPWPQLTIDTGTIPLWQAWDAFCRQAGVTEQASLRPDLTLKAGTGGAADTSGVFRVRLWQGKWDDDKEAQQLPLLEVRADPALYVDAIEDVRVEALRDGRGQVVPLAAPLLLEVAGDPLLGGAPVPSPGVLKGTFRPPLDAGARLGEVRGSLRARVRLERPLLVVDGVMRAVGKTQRGADGLALKVLEAETHDDGDVFLRVRLDGLDRLPPPARGQEAVRVRPGVVALRGPADVALELLQLCDGQGRKVPRVQASADPVVDGTPAAVFRLRYQPRPDATADLRLVLGGHRLVTLTAPFAIKDGP